MGGAASPALTITDARLGDATGVAVRCVDGRVAAVGVDVQPADGDVVVHAAGGELFPTLVNGHTHSAMTLLRGTGDDLPLMRWLTERVWPVEGRLTPDDVYWGARLACVEMVRSGTAEFFDMYFHPDQVVRAALDTGMRAVVAGPVFDGGPDATAESRAAARAHAEASLDAVETAAAGSPSIRAGLAPHAIYTVSEDTLRWVAAEAEARGCLVQIHLSETLEEVESCVDRFGVRPAQHLDRVGLLGPHTVLAHGCWLDASELALIADAGATVVTNPSSNLKLAVGEMFPLAQATAARVRVGLGTDGAASNDTLDLLAEMKTLALVQKLADGDASAAPAAEVLDIATGARSAVLGAGATGAVEVGARADLMVLDVDDPGVVPATGPVAAVFAATGAHVRHVIVDGGWVVRDGQVSGTAEVVAQARSASARLLG